MIPLPVILEFLNLAAISCRAKEYYVLEKPHLSGALHRYRILAKLTLGRAVFISAIVIGFGCINFL